MTTPTGAPQPADKPTVYRGPGALIGGVIVLLFCLGGAIDLIVEEGTVDLVGAAVMLVVGSLAFAYGVYPAAFSRQDELVVRNPLRTITLPWGAVTRTSAQLSFIVHTATQKFTVWAVPVSIRDRRKAERARLKELARQHREQDRSSRPRRGGGLAGLGGFGGGTTRSHPGSEIDRLSYADQATTEMNARREQWLTQAGLADAAPPATDEKPAFAWNLPTIVPILATVVFLVVVAIVH